ncbi:hypothetical protein M0R88_16800 [Halorussus gelatinilyticus]|uniref:Copper resistance protein D domain-containing protein n=1 Tax=Halorussus gelatinilyticus TaxID=2937524 RepID=A0A8U0IJB2_9EURY|nr:hypothetical protein [Halorussus gelatinilyticus]UPW00159.1 hypothetical protein M0R88_16800 [Halorussus gelatinilyticus]
MLAVRALHVLAMALVLGGATLTWWLFRQVEAGGDADSAASPATETAVSVAAAYERGFWAALGVLVMTGVGNLGSLAPYVPGAETQWGTVFAAKLALVVAVLALSVVRTLLVVRSRRAGGTTSTGASNVGARTLRLGYGATALSLAVLVALAEVLAHG